MTLAARRAALTGALALDPWHQRAVRIDRTAESSTDRGPPLDPWHQRAARIDRIAESFARRSAAPLGGFLATANYELAIRAEAAQGIVLEMHEASLSHRSAAIARRLVGEQTLPSSATPEVGTK